MKLKLWPSGHSTTYTVVATFPTGVEAERMRQTAHRMDSDATVLGRRLLVSVYTDGGTGEDEDWIREKMSPNSVETYLNYIRVVIEVKLPGPYNVSPLLLDKDESRAINELSRVAKMATDGNVVTFRYEGESILATDSLVFPYYSEYDAPDFEFNFKSRENWSVRNAEPDEEF